MRGGMAQRQHLERRPHLGDLLDLAEIERGDPHAAARLADRQPLRLEPAKGLAHRHMAGVELVGDMILPQPAPGSIAPEMIRSASALLIRTAMVSSVLAMFYR